MPDAFSLAKLRAEWQDHQPAVFGAAYRILGSVADAEDVAQDVWLRAAGARLEEVEDLRAWLVTVAARRSYDLLRSARARRETYVGPWLPEPLLTGPDAAEPVLVDDTVSTAMLLLMEELSPPERVAFVLRRAFDLPYERIAEILDRSTAACRQMVSRAGRKVGAARRPQGSTARQKRLLAAFRSAYETGDVTTLVELLSADVVYITDGGGEVSAARNPIRGVERVVRVLTSLRARRGPCTLLPVEVNGEPGFLVMRGTTLFCVDTVCVEGGRITELRRVLNPRKLSHLAAPSRLPGGRQPPTEGSATWNSGWT